MLGFPFPIPAPPRRQQAIVAAIINQKERLLLVIPSLSPTVSHPKQSESLESAMKFKLGRVKVKVVNEGNS